MDFYNLSLLTMKGLIIIFLQCQNNVKLKVFSRIKQETTRMVLESLDGKKWQI